MTVSNIKYRMDYDGNSSTTVFPVDFYFLRDDALLVVLTKSDGTENTLVLNTDYTVQDAGVPAGGSVTLSIAPDTGEKLTIIRNVAFTQLTDYIENDNFPAESHETALDKLTMEVQQLQEEVDRASKTSIGVGGPGVGVLPSTSNNLVNYDGAGNIGPSGKDLDEVAVLDASNEWEASQTYVETTLTDVDPIDWNPAIDQVTKVTIGANRTLNAQPTHKAGGTYILTIIQDGIGNRTITWGAEFKWEAATPPVLAAGASQRTILSFLSNGTNLYGGIFWKEG